MNFLVLSTRRDPIAWIAAQRSAGCAIICCKNAANADLGDTDDVILRSLTYNRNPDSQQYTLNP